MGRLSTTDCTYLPTYLVVRCTVVRCGAVCRAASCFAVVV